jgi:hypothetical protein
MLLSRCVALFRTRALGENLEDELRSYQSDQCRRFVLSDNDLFLLASGFEALRGSSPQRPCVMNNENSHEL